MSANPNGNGASDRLVLAERLVDRIGDRAEAEVLINGGSLSLTRFANSFIHQNVGEDGDSITVRVSVDGRVASATTTRTADADLDRFVDELLASASLQPVDPGWPGLAAATEVDDVTVAVDNYDEATAGASPAERAGMVAAFVGAAEGTSAAGYCQTTDSAVVFANSLGTRWEGRSSSAIVDGIHRSETAAGSAHGASSRLADLDGAAIGRIAADRAAEGADPYDIKPGDYEVVLSPECVATICIFLSAYGFNAKAHHEGQSFVELGADQFDPTITLVDDSTDPRAIGIGFDSEGTAKRRLSLVEGGTTTNLAHDRRTAAQSGVESTGHGASGSNVMGPVATMLFLAGGTTPVDQLIAGVERGLYVATFNYCRILDPRSMAITGLTRNGTFMIENGSITGAVTNLRFTQSFVDAFGPGNVVALGDDARFADSEFGPSMVHAPSARLANWRFTGGKDG